MTARHWFWVVVTGYAAVVVAGAAVLPDRVPLHFGADGGADRFGSRAEAVATSGLLGLGMVALFVGLAAATRRFSVSWINIPHKDYWTAPQRESRLRRMVATDLYVLGAITMALLLAVQLVTFAASREHDPSFGPWGWVALGVFLAVLCGYLVHMVTVRYRPRDA